MSGFDSRRYLIIWEVVGLKRSPLSLVSTIEELLESKSSSSGIENGDYGRRGSSALTTRHPLDRYSSLTNSARSSFVCFVLTRPETKKDCAGEGQQLLCAMLRTNALLQQELSLIIYAETILNLQQPVMLASCWCTTLSLSFINVTSITFDLVS
jgi:hypothetical protein